MGQTHGAAPAVLALIGVLCCGPVAAQSPDLIRQGNDAYYRGDLPAAGKLAKKHSTLFPRRPEGLVLLARTRMAEGAHEAAFKSLREALRRDPHNIDTLYYLGLVSAALAGVEFQELMAMAPESARAHQFLAESYVGEGNTSKAVEEYQAALILQPRSVEILVALAEVERSRSRFDEALAYYSRAHEIDRNDYTTNYGIGLVHLRRGEPEKAIDYFRRAATLEPAAAIPHMALGMALFRSGDPVGAISELKTATALDPNLRQAYTYLAQAFYVTGRSAEAQQMLQMANQLAAEESKADQRRLSEAAPGSGLPADSPGVPDQEPK